MFENKHICCFKTISVESTFCKIFVDSYMGMIFFTITGLGLPNIRSVSPISPSVYLNYYLLLHKKFEKKCND